MAVGRGWWWFSADAKQAQCPLSDFLLNLCVVSGVAKRSHVPLYGLYTLGKGSAAECLRGGFCGDRVFTGIDQFDPGGVIGGVCEVSGYLVLHILIRSVLIFGLVSSRVYHDRLTGKNVHGLPKKREKFDVDKNFKGPFCAATS